MAEQSSSSDSDLPKLKPQTLGEAISARLSPNLPLLLGLFAAYASGSLGLGLFSVVVIIWVVYTYALLWADKEALKNYRRYIDADERKKNKVEYESGEWLNIMLKKMWPHVGPQWAQSLKNSLTWSLANYVTNAKPSMIKSIYVKAVDLGHKAPRITAVSGLKAPAHGYDFRLDADLVYYGEMFVKLEVTAGSGLININVPITIDELWMKGKMRFDFKFRSRGGTFKAIATSFRTAPQIGFRIVTGKSIDLMDLPAFKDMIAKTVNESIKFYMVDPKSWVYEFGGAKEPASAAAATVAPVQAQEPPKMSTPENVPAASPAPVASPRSVGLSLPKPLESSQEQKISPRKVESDSSVASQPKIAAQSRPSSLDLPRGSSSNATPAPKKGFSSILRSLEGVNPEEEAAEQLRRKKKLIQQAQAAKEKVRTPLLEDDSEFVVVKPPEIDGTLKVRVVEAVELAGGEVFSCDPYIVVECGGASHKTDVVDSTSNPHWNNAEFEFSVSKSDPDNMKLVLRAFDHDLVGSDTKMGRAEIDLSSIIQRHEEELLDIWIPLMDADSGRIHVQLTYYPEYN